MTIPLCKRGTILVFIQHKLFYMIKYTPKKLGQERDVAQVGYVTWDNDCGSC